MVIQGRPNVNLLPPAGGRVAQTALQLRDQGIRVRGQNIQAELARLQADLRREQLSQQQRQFDVNTMIRRETLAVESQFREQEIALREETLGLNRQRFDAAENRFEQSIDLETQRFTEGRRQFDIQSADRQIQRERESEGLALKNAKDLLALSIDQGGLVFFNPETKQWEVRGGASDRLQEISDAFKAGGRNVPVHVLVGMLNQRAALENRQVMQQDVGRAAQLALTQARTEDLRATTEQKLGLTGGLPRQAQQRVRDIESRLGKLGDTSRKIQREVDSIDQDLAEKVTELPEEGEPDPGLAAEIQALRNQRAQRQSELRLLGEDFRELTQEQRETRGGVLPAGVEPFQPVEEELASRAAAIPQNRVTQDLVNTAPLAQEVDFWDNAIETIDEDIRMRGVAVDDPKQWERVRRQLEGQKSRFIVNKNEADKQLKRSERTRAETIGNLPLRLAVSEQIALTAQIDDIRNEIQGDMSAVNEGNLDLETQQQIEEKVRIRRKFLDRATQTRMQLANQIDIEGRGGNIRDVSRLLIEAVQNPANPSSERVINEAVRVIDPDISAVMGEVGEGFRGALGFGEARATQVARGRPIVNSMRDGSFYADFEDRAKTRGFKRGLKITEKFEEVGEFPTRIARSVESWLGIRQEVPPRLVPIFDETFRRTRVRFPLPVGGLFIADRTRNQDDFMDEITREIRQDVANGDHQPEFMPAVAAALIAAGVPLGRVVADLKEFDHFDLINAPRAREEVPE